MRTTKRHASAPVRARRARSSSTRHAIASVSLFALGFAPASAWAQDKAPATTSKQECIAAYEATQSLREAGKLVEAREQAIVCARTECPKALNTECMGWVGEIEKSTPTVVFAAKSPDGQDISTVKVSVDGALVTEELGARAVPLDPGKRVFRFDSADHGSKEVELVLREGEKNRTVSVSYEPEKASDGPELVPPPPESPSESSGGGPPASFWVLGGAGIAAVAVGVVFEVVGLSQKSDLEACKPSCDPADADAMTRSFVVGDTALVAGGVALGAAMLVLLTHDGGDTQPASARAGELRPVVVASPWGAFGGVSASF